MRIHPSGRSFERQDSAEALARVVISRSLAERLFATESPVRQRSGWAQTRRSWKSSASSATSSIALLTKRSSQPYAVRPAGPFPLQHPRRSQRTRGRRCDRHVRDTVAQLDGNLPVYRMRAMGEVVAASPGFPERRLLTAAFQRIRTARGAAQRHRTLRHRRARRCQPARRARAPAGSGSRSQSFCALRWHAESSWLQPV